MNEERIREAFLQIHTEQDADRRIVEEILAGKDARSKKKTWQRSIAAAAACMLLMLGAVQIPQVGTYADSAIEYFSAIFHADGQELAQDGGFLHVSEDASTKWQKFDKLSQIEEEVGLKLLKYDGADERKGSWDYYAATEESLQGIKDAAFEFNFTNRYYVTGDLQNVRLKEFTSADTVNTISYEPGKVFRSPISCQIIVLTDKYKKLSGDRSLDDGIMEIDTGGAEAKRYYCENLDTEVLIYETYTDGPAAWNQVESRKTACLKFYYKGIYYDYMGQIDTLTMLEFARALHE